VNETRKAARAAADEGKEKKRNWNQAQAIAERAKKLAHVTTWKNMQPEKLAEAEKLLGSLESLLVDT